jgi:hypothetical protein
MLEHNHVRLRQKMSRKEIRAHFELLPQNSEIFKGINPFGELERFSVGVNIIEQFAAGSHVFDVRQG